MRLRYDGTCECGREVTAGSRAGWDRSNKMVVCTVCLDTQPSQPATELEPAPVAEAVPEAVLGPGLPGASLVREYESRKKRREDRVRAKHPKIGGFLLAISDEPRTTKAFATGAEGERRVAARLEELAGGNTLFMHNRRRGATARSGDIDHIAIASSGVFIIDAKNYANKAKNYANKKVRVRRTGGLFSPIREHLIVGGRDRSSLLDSIDKQAEAVRHALADHVIGRGIEVTAVLCFVGADLPMFGNLQVRGVSILGPRAAGKMLNRPGTLDDEQRREIWLHLAVKLPPA